MLRQTHGPPLDPPLITASLKYPVDINAGDVHLIGIQITGTHQVLDFGNRNRSCLCHRSGKIAGSLAKYQVAQTIPLPGLDDRKTGRKSIFHEMRLTPEL